MAYTTINKGSSYFNTVLYTGNDATDRSITGVGFQPDFTWIKSRSNAFFHELYDVVRGFSSTTNGRVLYSNVTNAEGTPNTFNSFNTDGFTVSKQSGETGTNGNGATFVAWNWLANGAGVSNTAGTITSTVSANTTAGFSIVSYTGTGANATVGHGLGVAPDMIICKSRTQAQNWATYHSSLGNTKAVFLDGSGGASTSSSYWNNTSPTSTLFTVGNSGDVNFNAGTQISYCFSSIKGYSKFGSYTGNGSTNGPFVYTGFKPAFVMSKRTDDTDNWRLFDNKRNTFNIVNNQLLADLENAENTNTFIDFLSNGFKYRLDGGINTSSGTYIYMAFAENPFVSSTLIPTTAR